MPKRPSPPRMNSTNASPTATTRGLCSLMLHVRGRDRGGSDRSPDAAWAKSSRSAPPVVFACTGATGWTGANVTLYQRRRSICASEHADARSPPAPPPSPGARTPSGIDFAVDPAHVGAAAAGHRHRADRGAVGRRLLGDEDVSR